MYTCVYLRSKALRLCILESSTQVQQLDMLTCGCICDTCMDTHTSEEIAGYEPLTQLQQLYMYKCVRIEKKRERERARARERMNMSE